MRAFGFARRRMFLEPLEGRSLLAALPYGAMPDDTGEYMLGDVLVNVVLMESDASMNRRDVNGDPTLPADANQEDWTSDAIAAVKAKVEEGVNWWKETLATQFPQVPELLNFAFDYTYADSPVLTGYEAINNRSNMFEDWIEDFFDRSGFNATDSFNTNIRAFNHAQRLSHESHWSFTIFVVNDEHDTGGTFAAGGDFSQAFAYPGGQFLVVPASRPTATIAHETGHMFWALDEYLGIPNNYLQRRGYYRTQNLNAGDNPDPDYDHQSSIMSNGSSMSTAFGENTSSKTSLEMIGWKDSDSNGIFDVLDVPFTLLGSGRYDPNHQEFDFKGHSKVNTLPNMNFSGLANDITINIIREVQYSIDGAAWESIDVDDKYVTDLDLSIPMPSSAHQIRIRTIDTVTGAMSPEFVGGIGEPSISSPSGVQGYVWLDNDFDGEFDADELPMSDFPVKLVDDQGRQINMRRYVDGDDYALNSTLGQVHAEARMSAIPGRFRSDEADSNVYAINGGGQYAGQVFGVRSKAEGAVIDSWSMDSRRLRVDFTTPVSMVGLRAYGLDNAGIGRMEAYSSSGQLVARYTTNPLTFGNSEYMSIARPTADISYIVAGGHQTTLVALDSLDWGAYASTTTASDGSYRLPSLPAGNYKVKVDIPTFQLSTTVIGGIGAASITNDGGAETLRFGIAQLPNPWHNTLRPSDVDNSGGTDAADILYVLRYYGIYPEGESLSESGPNTAMYVDVDNDGIVSPSDILWTIYYYTRQSQVPGNTIVQGGGSGGGSQSVGGGAEDGANGETTPFFFPYIASDHEEHRHEHADGDHHHDEVESAPVIATAPMPALALTTAEDPAETPLATAALDVVAALADHTDDADLDDVLLVKKADEEEADSASQASESSDDAILALLDESLV